MNAYKWISVGYIVLGLIITAAGIWGLRALK